MKKLISIVVMILLIVLVVMIAIVRIDTTFEQEIQVYKNTINNIQIDLFSYPEPCSELWGISGEMKNTSTRSVNFIKMVFVIEDLHGNVVKKQNNYILDDTIVEPGESTSFNFIFQNTLYVPQYILKYKIVGINII